MNFIVFIILSFIFSLTSLSSEVITNKNVNFSINFSNFVEVKKSLKKHCKSNKFLLNLRNHASYPKFGSYENWKKVCEKIINTDISHNFIEKYFSTLQFSKKGILTGYYEPSIKISTERDKDFKFPILKKSKKLEFERKKIIKIFKNKDVLFWTDNNIDLFFLQIQGSGVGILQNGEKIMIKYHGHNNHKYTSIGKILVENGHIKKEKISMFTIKEWLHKNILKSEEIMNQNKRYIFFKKEPYSQESSSGAMGNTLIAGTSIAIDKSLFPYGIPFLIKTDENKFNKIVISHDTGSAIKGYNRADLFTGRGKKAEIIAGNLKKPLQLISLVPYISD